MPKPFPAQNNFNAGELSTLVQGRSDLDKYTAGLSTCVNAIPLIQGPWTRRVGTKYVAEVKDSSAKTRLVRFEFSTTQAYIIEFGNLYMRFYKDNGQIVGTGTTIEGATKADPCVITDTAHGFTDGDRVVITGVVGMTELNNREFIVANKTANTYEIQDAGGTDVDSSAYTTYSSGGAAAQIIEVATTYATADLFELKFVQSADVLYVAHPSYAPRKITRTSHTAWTISTIDFLDGPYLDINTTATTITPSATTGTSINLTASAALWASTDVGRLVRIKHSSTWGYAKITSYTSTTVVVADVVNDFAATTASANWRLGIWSDTTSYPSAVTFYEDRLVFGGALNVPQRVTGSKSGDYENFAPTATDGTVANDNAISFTLNAKSVNVIQWLADDEKGLLIGTVASIWLMRPSALNEAVSPTNISAKRSSSYGSKDVEPVQLGSNTLYVQTKGRKLREIEYKFDKDGLVAEDTTAFSEHITKGGINEIAVVEDPVPIVWAVRNDGQLLGLTLDKQNKVEGWHRHVLGGTDVVVESVDSVPDATSTRDETWLIVKRTIDGNTVRYIEYIDTEFEDGDDQDDAYFFDAGLQADDTAATVFTGLWHLNGETLGVLGDGATQPDVTVTNGKITIATAAAKLSVGLKYNSDGETQRWEAVSGDETGLGKSRRINRVAFLLSNTGALTFGRDFDNLDVHSFRKSGDLTANAVPLFSGIKVLEWPGDNDFDGRIAWRTNTGLPLTVLAVAPQGQIEDRR